MKFIFYNVPLILYADVNGLVYNTQPIQILIEHQMNFMYCNIPLILYSDVNRFNL